MTFAYREEYLDDAMKNLGDMVDYAVYDCGYEPDEFFDLFISSGIASQFETGNPKYVAGMSGVELAQAVLRNTKGTAKFPEASFTEEYGREYWAGWILAYYQWARHRRFEDIVAEGLPLSKICDMYVLHEADPSKFMESADIIIERYKSNRPTKLHIIRKARRYTQQQLSEASGVTLRMIQLYEQRQNDINKARVDVVVSLARALGCEIEDILE